MNRFIDYKSAWITVNRACNLRCQWCYAKGTKYSNESNMPLDLAKEITDICGDLKIRHITLIGGEPTIYPELINLLDYIQSKGISVGFVSNGVRFSDELFLDTLISCGIKKLSISLKGENRNVFREVTGCDAYNKVILGIKNCLRRNIKVSVSMVLSENNIPSYLDGIKYLKELGINSFHFSFCYEFDTSPEYKQHQKSHIPYNVVQKFQESYFELDRITEHNFNLFQTYPLCIWNKSLVQEMRQNNQLSSVCQLLRRNGLLFDEKGYVIPCNAMYPIKLAHIHEDFNNAADLLRLTKSEQFVKAYTHLCSVPSLSCMQCDELPLCGGGCVCQWTNYSFDELMDSNQI